MTQMMALLIGLVLLGPAATAWAQAAPPEGRVKQSPRSAASIAATVAYVPLKAAVCVLGGTAGLLGAIIDGPKSSRVIGNAACGGTWVITPEMLRRREPINVVAEAAAP